MANTIDTEIGIEGGSTNGQHLFDLCEQFKQRSETLGYKGKRRDDMVIEFMVGAANGFMMAGNRSMMQFLSGMIQYGFAFRGWTEVCMIVSKGRPQ